MRREQSKSVGIELIHVYKYQAGQYRSRREIDLATGVLMGSRHCSADDAWAAILEAVTASGIGPGGVSRALLGVVTGEAEHDVDPATTHWKVVLGLAG